MTEQNRREILVETVKSFGRQEWFRDAVVHDAFSVNKEPTLEFKVNHKPLRIIGQIQEFVMRYNLGYHFTVVDKNGNPVE
jgi:hypothetical protein